MRIRDPRLSLHTPHLLDVEVAQVLRRYVRAGNLDADRVVRALVGLQELDVERWPHEPFLARIWELRENLTAYDGAYVALAEALACPLLTLDRRTASSPNHNASIEHP